MRIKHIPLFILLLVVSTRSFAQGIIGLWEVTEVTVGSEIMTPVAKWTRINNNNTFLSGNGWLQNDKGTWSFDSAGNFFYLETGIGVKDEFGAFRVSFSGNSMYWQRKEEGTNVKVTLNPISELPKSTGDKITGFWKLIQINEEGKPGTDLFVPEYGYTLLLKWDKTFIETSGESDKKTGYWHINGHRPELSLYDPNDDKETDIWKVTVTESKLTLLGISESNKNSERIYKRIFEMDW